MFTNIISSSTESLTNLGWVIPIVDSPTSENWEMGTYKRRDDLYTLELSSDIENSP